MKTAIPATNSTTRTVRRVHFTIRFDHFGERFDVDLSPMIVSSFLFLVSCIGFSRTRCWLCRNKSELLHERELVKRRPFLFDFAVHNPPDRDPGLFCLFPGGRQTVACTSVSAARNPVDRDQVAFGH